MTATSAPRRELVVNDIHSALNPTRIAARVLPRSTAELCAAVHAAAAAGRAVSIAGGRHAMGAQQFGTHTLLVDTSELCRVVHFDSERGTVEVQAGIRWPELVAATRELQQGEQRPWAIAQKQTGADRLSIGGALAANIHGRGLRMRPFIADIVSFHLVDASGALRVCSRTENAELFRLAIGGYGLFGIVATVTLQLVRRSKLERLVELIDTPELMGAFEARIADGCRYGDFQFAIDPESPDFLRRGVFSCYLPLSAKAALPSVQHKLTADDWTELLWLAHTNKSEGFRRYADYYLTTHGQRYESDTHQLGVYLDDYHRAIDERSGSPQRCSEVISELYVPRGELENFLTDVRADFRRHDVNLIYGTIRLIERDDESFLAWARESFVCVIFNLHTEHSPAGRAHSRRAFRRLIDMAIRRRGSYYLTYHKHATRPQVESCYPQFAEFLALKRAHDPQQRFQSDWYRHYARLFEN